MFASDSQDSKLPELSMQKDDDKLNQTKSHSLEVINISDTSPVLPSLKEEEQVLNLENNLNIIAEEQHSRKENDGFIVSNANMRAPRKSIYLKPGKLWRRSLSLFRRNTLAITEATPIKLSAIHQEGNCFVLC